MKLRVIKDKSGAGRFILRCTLSDKESLNTFDAVRFIQRPHENLLEYEYAQKGRGYCLTYTYPRMVMALKDYMASMTNYVEFCMLLKLFSDFFMRAESDGIQLKAVVFNQKNVYLARAVDGNLSLLFVYLPTDAGTGGLPDALDMLKHLPDKAKGLKDGSCDAQLAAYQEFFDFPEAFSAIKFEAFVNAMLADANIQIEGEKPLGEVLHVPWQERSASLSYAKTAPAGGVRMGRKAGSEVGNAQRASSRSGASGQGAVRAEARAESRANTGAKQQEVRQRAATLPQAAILQRVSTRERWKLSGSIVLGSDVKCGIVVQNKGTISRRHASIMLDKASGRWSLRDEFSTNGTFVNGRQVAKGATVPLSNGTCFSLAEEQFIFECC